MINSHIVKALKQDKVSALVVPKYKELSVSCIWNFVKVIDDLWEYFPDLEDGQYPERKFLIAIISTLNPDATKHLVAEARAKRSIQKEQEDSNLVKLTPELEDEIMNSVRF